MQQTIARALAVLGPVLVLGLGYGAMSGFLDQEDAMAAQNAGMILNARVIERGAAEAMDYLLDQKEPEVLIIGPSYANTDVRPELLAARLEIPRRSVLMLSVPNSVASHWYAVLKYRVFGNGHRPKLIVVVSGLQSMLLNTPLTESSFVNLQEQLEGVEDPLIEAKVRQTASLRWARLREQRGNLRERLFDALRYRPVAALMPSRRGEGPMMPPETRASLDRVFDDSRVDMKLYGTSTPIVEADRAGERAYGPELLPSPEASFMGDITALAQEHGARVIWVRPPMSPNISAEMADVVLPGVEEQVLELVHSHGGDFVDMRGLPMTTAMFKNEDHMNQEGSRRFSEALANALGDLDALEVRADPGSLPPLQVTVEVEGEERPLPAAEAAWAGAGRWLSPGTTTTWMVDEGWNPVRGRFAVSLSAEQLSTSGPPPFEVTLQGRALPLTAQERGGGGRRWVSSLQPAAPDNPFAVAIHVPEESPPVRITGLSVGRRLGRTFLVGDATAMDGATAPLFGVQQVVGGTLEDITVRPDFTAPPGPVPGKDREVVDLRATPMAAFETKKWAFLSDEALIGETNFGSRCSPLRVTEDGQLLPLANVPCTEVKRRGKGRSCHTTDRIYFTSLEGPDPAYNGKKYGLVLDEQRLCDGAVWLYPKDRFEVAWPKERLEGFREGAAFFTLDAKYLNFRPAPIHVTLTVEGEVLIDEDIPGKLFKLSAKVWAFDKPISPNARDVRLTIENKAHVFYLITEATLSEHRPQGLRVRQ